MDLELQVQMFEITLTFKICDKLKENLSYKGFNVDIRNWIIE